MGSWAVDELTDAEPKDDRSAFEPIKLRLHLRDPLKLNLLIAEDGIQDLAALVQEIDDLVEFVAADIRPASLRYPSDLRRAAGWLRACARGADKPA